MGKVVIERPRARSNERSVKARNMVKIIYRDDISEDFEDSQDYYRWDHEGPIRFSGKKAVRLNRKLEVKESTDLLGPIKRFLRKSVGRAWNDVYSEACEVLSNRNVAISHVLDHLRDMVFRNNEYRITESGEYWHARWNFEINGSREAFIVDDNGILRHLPKKYTKKLYQSKHTFTKLETSDNKDASYYLKCDGIWFEVKFIDETYLFSIIKQQSRLSSMFDEKEQGGIVNSVRKYFKNENILSFYGKYYLVRKIRTLSKKEIKSLHRPQNIDKVIWSIPESVV